MPELFEQAFENIGRFVARRPCLTIFFALVVIGACGGGYPMLKNENRAEKQWVPRGAMALDHKDYTDVTWPSTQRFNFWIAKSKDGSNVMTAKYIQEESSIPILVSSFKHRELFEFREIDKHTPVAPLFHEWDAACFELARNLDAYAINCSNKIITQERVEAIKQNNFKVFAYTVNLRNEAKRLQDLGVDGIFSDRPDRMKEWML